MQAVRNDQRTWRFPKLLVSDQLWFALYVWAGAALFTFVVTIVVSFFVDISISAWEIATGAAPWFVGILSGWVMFTMVPLFVASGRTRRDSFIEWAIFAAIYPIWTAFLTVIGYLLEYLIYGIAGWPRTAERGHIFSSHTDVGMIFLEYFLTLLVWTTVGGFVGVSLYRSQDLGWLSIIPGVVLVGLAGAFMRSPIVVFIDRFPALDASSAGLAIVYATIATVIAVALSWRVVRDMPLRNK